MSGIFGICTPGRSVDPSVAESMLSATMLPGEAGHEITSATGIAMGVAQRWPSQEVAVIPGVRIAIDADIYNLSEVQSTLASNGFESKGWSMARCLAHLYTIRGSDFLRHLDGIFSLALWDEREQRLLLAIDRLGVKGLFWSYQNDRLLFGTRLTAIRAASQRSVRGHHHAGRLAGVWSRRGVERIS